MVSGDTIIEFLVPISFHLATSCQTAGPID